ncbi:hypothetical protein VKI21_06325 [Cyanobacterium aponinum UTEX 3222]|uniref:hypothetical protein n=1 Tax=Cyanobacterium aponinum TaxID=379064 RepID=UPI0030936647|nr:hypothetical protein VKI21_06325 [Cyanobacterium aponinum UTEX 3222]
MLRYKILNNCVSLSSLGLVNCFPERSIFQEKLVNFLPHHTEISFTEIHSQIIADPDFYNCFIPPYFFRNIIFYLYRNQSVINITNPQDIYTQWNVSLLN